MVSRSRFVNEQRQPATGLVYLVRRLSFSAAVQTALDILVLFLSFTFAYLLRFDFSIPPELISHFLIQAPAVIALQFLILTVSGARSFIWRYAGLSHVWPFLWGGVASLIMIATARLILPEAYQSWRVPLSVSLMGTLLAFGGTFATRVARRLSYEQTKKRSLQKQRVATRGTRPVLLIGAGQAGVLAAKEILGRGDLDLDIKGFVDDDRSKLGRIVVAGRRILGTTEDLPTLVASLHIDHVVITIAQASRQDIQRLAKICEDIPVKVRIIPGLYEILDGRVGISRIRDVQIEDLLGREPVALDTQSINAELAGKTVMVTGAGGSIGSELAKQVSRFSPGQLLLVERAEFALFNVDRALREQNSDGCTVPLVADIGDVARMRAIFEKYRPQVIIHAAAHKHVPLMEVNPYEAIKNNVLNTRLLSELAAEFEAEVLVLISTDKAVRPTSIMGASKRLAELVAQDVGSRSKTRFVAVRFGNVIGSNGSAIPIFQEQIRKGGPVTITDRRMRRYFMTIPEAAQLVLQASTIGKGGEVFILHMGEPVSIMDLAEALISLSGFKPHHDIRIVETGIRPGEKLNEELRFQSEETRPTSHPKIFIYEIATLDSQVVESAVQFLKTIQEVDEADLRRFLNRLLPEARLNPTSPQDSSTQSSTIQPVEHSSAASA